MAPYMLFLTSGGMILPYIVGIFALNEPLTLPRALGLLVMIGGIVYSNYPKGTADGRLILKGALVFLLNGMVSIVSKLHQIETHVPAVSTTNFLVLSSVSSAILCAAAVFLLRRKGAGQKPAGIFRKVIPVILLAAVMSGAASLLQLAGAKNLPATVLYPMVTGGNIVLTALAGRVFFRERLDRRMTLGVALCFAGTLMFL